jgi:NhaP-type Na+/H+ and K+/H+ antiporter
LSPRSWSALALTAVLVFVARPPAVVVSLAPFRFPLPEQLFLAWAGLRGAVPIVLATFALSAGIAGDNTIFNTVSSSWPSRRSCRGGRSSRSRGVSASRPTPRSN